MSNPCDLLRLLRTLGNVITTSSKKEKHLCERDLVAESLCQGTGKCKGGGVVKRLCERPEKGCLAARQTQTDSVLHTTSGAG